MQTGGAEAPSYDMRVYTLLRVVKVPSADFWKDAGLEPGVQSVIQPRMVESPFCTDPAQLSLHVGKDEDTVVQMLQSRIDDGTFEPRDYLPLSSSAFLYRGAPWAHFGLVESLLRDA